MKITGRIEYISPLQILGEKEYEKQYFIISDEKGLTPNRLLIQGFNKSEFFKELKVGQLVDVDYYAKVSEHNEKHYCSLSLYKIKILEGKKTLQESHPYHLKNFNKDLPF